MKQSKNPLGKLAKNGFVVMVAALVLVSATLAWFAQTADDISVGSIFASILPHAEIKTYTAVISEEDTNILYGEMYDELCFRDEDFIYNGVRSKIVNMCEDEFYADDIAAGIMWPYAEGWSWETSKDFDASLYPGEFKMFRIDYTAVGASSVSLMLEKMKIDNANKDDVYKSVLFYRYAYKNDDYYNPIEQSYVTLEQIMNETYGAGGAPTSGTMDLKLFNTAKNHSIQIQGGDKITFIYLIGIPGDDGDYDLQLNSHAGLQQTGATVRIDRISVS